MGMNGDHSENEIWVDDTEQTQNGTADLEHGMIQYSGRHMSRLRDFPWVASLMSFVAGGLLVGMWLWLSPSNFNKDVRNRDAVAALSGDLSKTNDSATDANLMSTSETIMVDVKGDVRHPGVYTLPLNARARDAIRAAGGYVHLGDAAAVNEAMPLDDGMEFVVPNLQSASVASSSTNDMTAQSEPSQAGSVSGVGTEDEASSTRLSASSPKEGLGQTGFAPSVANKIDLNTATESTLETVPGIGPKRAQAILAYRAEHGGFTSVSQLLQIRGIGPTLYQRISAYVVVNLVKNGQKP